MTTSSLASGIWIDALHLGQGPFLPANFSLTSNRVMHLAQVTRIAIRVWESRLNEVKSVGLYCLPILLHVQQVVFVDHLDAFAGERLLGQFNIVHHHRNRHLAIGSHH